MSTRYDMNVIVSDWLDEQAGRGAPAYLDEILTTTSTTRQRPAWSSPERWLPVDLTLSQRIHPFPSVLRIAAVAAVLAALLAATLLVAGSGRPRLPHFRSAANGSLTYLDGATLKLASADGRTIRAGGAIPAGSESLTFSPDGTHLAYRTPGFTGSIFVADAEGGHPELVTSRASSSEQVAVDPSFAFAPDGGRLAFTGEQATYRTVHVADIDGRNTVSLAPIGATDSYETFDPAWSPDGQWIAFFWLQPASASGLTQIYLVHPDGSGGHVLAGANPDPANLDLAWSPDPAKVLLAYVDGGDASGGSVTVRDVSSTTAAIAGKGLWITWSPDGKQLAWWGGQTLVAPVAGVLAGTPQPIGLFPANAGPTCASHPELAGKAICGPAQWSPDSTLVYGTDVSGRMILVRHADGTGSVLQIPLDHPVDLANGPNGSLTWRAIAP